MGLLAEEVVGTGCLEMELLGFDSWVLGFESWEKW